MDNRAFAEKLERRTRKFAVDIIRLSADLPNTPESMVVKNQLTKSGTSIGANYREANRSRSKADFKSRIKICESEASETFYWLRIINEIKWLPFKKISPVYNECNELISIFTTASKNLSIEKCLNSRPSRNHHETTRADRWECLEFIKYAIMPMVIVLCLFKKTE